MHNMIINSLMLNSCMVANSHFGKGSFAIYNTPIQAPLSVAIHNIIFRNSQIVFATKIVKKMPIENKV